MSVVGSPQRDMRNYLRLSPLMCAQQHSVVCVCGRAGPFASKPLRTVPSLPTVFNLLAQNFHFFHAPCQQTAKAEDKHAALFSSMTAGKERNAVFVFSAGFLFVFQGHSICLM